MAAETVPEPLEARLERWEREKRQLLCLGVAAVTLCAGLALHANGWGHRPKAVEATSFVVRDRAGNVRARLGVRNDGSPELLLRDSHGRDQLLLHAFPDDTTAFYLYDRGRVRLALTAAPEGTAAVNLYDTDRMRSAGLYVESNGTAGVAFRDARNHVQLTAKPEDGGGMKLVDSSGHVVAQPIRAGINPPVPLAARTTRAPVRSAVGARPSDRSPIPVRAGLTLAN
jgi:hypothetical protein